MSRNRRVDQLDVQSLAVEVEEGGHDEHIPPQTIAVLAQISENRLKGFLGDAGFAAFQTDVAKAPAQSEQLELLRGAVC